MKELTVPAKIDQLDTVLAFVENTLPETCPLPIQFQLAIAVEEIYVNIAHYAYPEKNGEALIRCETEEDRITIQFRDWGIPYNPLAKEDPDITLSAEERQIGGLGIYMVKKSMDAVSYAYEDNQNVFTIMKLFAEEEPAENA